MSAKPKTMRRKASMRKPLKKLQRPSTPMQMIMDEPAPVVCTAPEGYTLVPVSPQGIVFTDGFNVGIFPFPTNPAGQRLIFTTAGLAWENV